MRRQMVMLALALALAALAVDSRAFTDEEHRRVSQSAFAEAMRTCFPDAQLVVSPASLASVTVHTSSDDRAPGRYQVRGETPWEQVRPFGWDRIARIVDEVTARPPTGHAFAPYADNAVANYATYHLIAIRCAEKARAEPEWLEHALVYEAVAVGYLTDAFSSSHILTPAHLPLARLQDANVRAAHEFFATQGAYVVDGRGVAWQTFGDGVLEWYGRPYEMVLYACVGSIGDLDLARRGRNFSSIEDTMLSRVPMVVTATWSVCGDTTEARRHYPQLREDALHDPALAVDTRFLYARDAVPAWLIPDEVSLVGPRELTREDPRWASVEYYQTLDVPPAFAGLLVIAGGGVLAGDDGGGGVGSIAAGYGWDFRVPLLARLRASLEAEYLPRLGDPDRRVIVPRCTIGIGSPVLPWVDAIHFEAGYAWGLRAPFKDQGVKWGVGIDTHPLRFPFTYAGVSARLKYERFWLDETLDGFQLQLVFR